MFKDTFFRRLVFNFALIFIFLSIYLIIFYPIYISDEIIISFAVNPFNICKRYPDIWNKIKLIYIPITIISSFIVINLIYSFIFTKRKIKKRSNSNIQNDLSLFITNDSFGYPIYLPEASLYQNILITGTIGSGKTSSAMYPFTRQLIKYNYDNNSLKLGMLILDVKGNYYTQVKKYVSHYRRNNDLVIIELRWHY